MLTVLPEKDDKKTEELFLSAELDFGEGCRCVTARNGDEILGYCLFKIENDAVYILYITPQDDILLSDGILRSALFFASRQFVFKAFYGEKTPDELFSKLGFVKNSAERSLDMDMLFKDCSCKK